MYDAFKELKHTPASKGISFHLLNERQQMHSIHLHHVRNSFSQARHFRFVCVVGETKRREKKKCPTEMRERNSHSVKKSHSVTVKHSRPVTSKTSTSYLYSNLTQVSRFKQKKALSLLPGKKMCVAKLREFCFTNQVTRKHQFPINYSIATSQKRLMKKETSWGWNVELPLTGACVIKLFRFEFT